MSTFAGLSTALSSLTAQRQSLQVAGQNIANANTVGYTRQRTTLSPIDALQSASLHSTPSGTGNGVRVSSIDRLANTFATARVHSETSQASFHAAQAASLGRLESSLSEPASTSVSSALTTYWASWEDVGNRPDDLAARNVLMGNAEQVAAQVSGGFRAVETQWSQMRSETDALITDVNVAATQIASFNEQIRGIVNGGGTANELMDQRDLLITQLSGLVGAEARPREDGTVDVMVGGNALVRGDLANQISTKGSYTMAGGTAGLTPDRVRLEWAGTGTAVNLSGGKVASHLSDLAPGGLLDAAAGAWNDLATNLAATVDAIHVTGAGLDGTTGREFFTIDPTQPSAVGLRVALTDPSHVAAGAPGQGGFDGTIADVLSQQGTKTDSPDMQWRAFVVDLGVRANSTEQRAKVGEAARATAENLLLAETSVDLDEETVNMLAHQRAYEGAARVLTAIDEMLDVLINRTGVVGR